MEEEYVDITQTGPQPLQGMNALEADKPKENVDDISAKELEQLDIIQQRARAFYNMPYQQMHELVKPTQALEDVGLTAMELGIGDSKYDDSITNLYQAGDINEWRARKQSTLAQVTNGIGKMATTFGTTYLSNTIGAICGLADAISNVTDDDPKTTFIQGWWNNKFNQAMAEFNNKMEEAMPNYYTEQMQNTPWYAKIFTANTLGDKLIKNAGFMAGAAAGMAIWSYLGGAMGIPSALTSMAQSSNAILSGIGRVGGKIMPWIITNFLGSNGEAAIEAVNSTDQNRKLLELNIQENQRKNDIALQQEFQNNVNSGMNVRDAIAIYQQHKAEYDNKLQEYKLEQENELAKAGNVVYGANVIALMLTNSINMGSFIKGGYKNSSSLWNNALFSIGEKSGGLKDFTTKELAEGILKGTLKADAKEIANATPKIIGRWGLNSLSEGIQEGVQSEISTTSEILTQSRLNKYAKDNNITDAYFNPQVTDEYITYASAALKAWDEQFGGIAAPGWEEVFIGTVSDALGMPTLNTRIDVRKDGTLGKKLKFGWNGGIVEAKYDITKDREDLQLLTFILNQKLQDPKQLQTIRAAIGNISIEDAKDLAVERQDIRRYKNLEIAQAVTNALYFKEIGLLDAYLDSYKQFAQNISDDDLNELIASTYNIDTKQDPLVQEKREDVKKRYQEKAQSTIDKINNVLSNYTFIRDKFSKKFDEEHIEEAITELVYRQSLYDDSIRRIEDLESQLSNLDGKKGKQASLQRASINRAISELQKQQQSLNEFMENAYNNPQEIQNDIDQVRRERYKDKIAREGKLAVQAYEKSNTIQDIADVYYRGIPEKRDSIIKQVQSQTQNEKTKDLINKFLDLKEDVDVIYDYVETLYKGVSGRKKNLDNLNNEVQQLLDSLVLQSLQDDGSDILQNLAQRLQDKSQEFQKQLNDKVRGPAVYDEYGRFQGIRDRDQYMMLQHFVSLFDTLHDKLLEVQDARETGSNDDVQQTEVTNEDVTDNGIDTPEITNEDSEVGIESNEVSEPMDDNMAELFGDTEDNGLQNIPEEEIESSENSSNNTTTQQNVSEENSESNDRSESNPIEIITIQNADDSDIPTEVQNESEQDRVKATTSKDSIKGNYLSPYKSKSLKNHQLEIVQYRTNNISKDNLIKIQNFIDYYLNQYAINNKIDSVKFNFLTIKSVPNITFLVIPYDSKSSFIPRSDVYIINAFDAETHQMREYIVAGTIGFYPQSKQQQDVFNTIRENVIKESELYDGENIVSSYYTTLKKQADGYFYSDQSNKKSLNDLLNDDSSNPLQLDSSDLRWSYVIGNDQIGLTEQYIKFNQDDQKYPVGQDGLHAGRVYLYIPTNLGRYVPVFLETQSLQDWFYDNKDTELGKELIKTIHNIASSLPGDIDRSKSLHDLYNLLVFSSDEHVVFPKRKDGSFSGVVVQSSDIDSSLIYKQFMDVVESMDMSIFGEESTNENNQEQVVQMKEQLLLDAILKINPRLAINANTLRTNPNFYIKSNALVTDCQKLCTIGSDIYINPVDDNMQVQQVKDGNGFVSQTTSVNRQQNFTQVFIIESDGKKTKYWYNTDTQQLYDQSKSKLIDKEKNQDLYFIANLQINRTSPTFSMEADYFEFNDGRTVIRYTTKAWEVLSESKRAKYYKTKERIYKKQQKEKERLEKEQSKIDTPSNDIILPETTIPNHSNEPIVKMSDDDVIKWIDDFVGDKLTAIEHDALQYLIDQFCSYGIEEEANSFFNEFEKFINIDENATNIDNIKSFLENLYMSKYNGNFAAFKEAVLKMNNESKQDDINNC